MMQETALAHAAGLLRKADGLLIGARAGIGVASGALEALRGLRDLLA